jgi:hypothetical protein
MLSPSCYVTAGILQRPQHEGLTRDGCPILSSPAFRTETKQISFPIKIPSYSRE